MFVITADQVASRTNPDLVPDALTAVSALEPGALALTPERTVGDEFQVLTANAATALKILLHLTRDGSWSVGLGVGTVDLPFPAHTREATGEAFIAARKAVTRAKCSPTRCAVESLHVPSQGHDVEALIDLLLALRARRTAAGWEVHDLLAANHTQRDVSVILGITPQSVSNRATTAALTIEARAQVALIMLLSELDFTRSPPLSLLEDE